MSIDEYLVDSHKLHLHPQRVAQWLDAGDDVDALMRVAPIYVEVSPVGACQHRCQMCSVDYIGYKNVRLSRAVLERAIISMADLGVKSIMYAGEGEPLLHREMAAIARWTESCGIDVSFTTNAVLLNEEMRHSLDCVTWLKASINGGVPSIYAVVHQTKEKDFHRVIENLTEAVELRNAMGWNVTLGSQMVLLPTNLHTACALARLSSEIGLDYLVIKPYSQNPNSISTAARGYDQFSYRRCEDLEAQLAEFNTDTFKVIYRSKTMANLEHERKYKTCHSTPFLWAYIMAEGSVYGCSAHLLNPDFELGNINSQSFSEIWHGDKRRKLIEKMRTFDLSSCRKNCRMNACNEYLWQLKHPAAHANFI